MNTTVFVLILFAHVGPMGDGNSNALTGGYAGWPGFTPRRDPRGDRDGTVESQLSWRHSDNGRLARLRLLRDMLDAHTEETISVDEELFKFLDL